MDLIAIVLIIAGLVFFEVINSVDNAIINADVLSTMGKKYRKWFLFMGMLFAVFVIRGFLPWIIIWFSNPSIGPLGAFQASLSSNPEVLREIEVSSPVLLTGAATFLLFLFFHWLFIEPKKIFLPGEKFFQSNFFMFYTFVSVILSFIVWVGIHKNSMMAFSAVVGATAFYAVEAVRRYAEEQSRTMNKKKMTNISKIIYLEVLDSSFSIDGVIGAFAFTLSVPLILIGNGIGALVVRHLTIKNVETIKKYKYLKKGAMYTIFIIGIIMLLNSFGASIPFWVPPLMTIMIVGAAIYASRREIGKLKIDHMRKIRSH